jgi:hypothetical protein
MSPRRGDCVFPPVAFGEPCALILGERVQLVPTTRELVVVFGFLTEGGLGAIAAGAGLRLLDKTEFFAAVEIVLI